MMIHSFPQVFISDYMKYNVEIYFNFKLDVKTLILLTASK